MQKLKINKIFLVLMVLRIFFSICTFIIKYKHLLNLIMLTKLSPLWILPALWMLLHLLPSVSWVCLVQKEVVRCFPQSLFQIGQMLVLHHPQHDYQMTGCQWLTSPEPGMIPSMAIIGAIVYWCPSSPWYHLIFTVKHI